MSSSASASRNFVPRSVWLGCAHVSHSMGAARASEADLTRVGRSGEWIATRLLPVASVVAFPALP